MNLFYFEQLRPEIKLYIGAGLPCSAAVLYILFLLMKKLVNKQVEAQVEQFADEAKIPNIWRNRIGVKIKWR